MHYRRINKCCRQPLSKPTIISFNWKMKIKMAKSFFFLILALLLLSTAENRPLSTTNRQQADDPQMPFSSPVSFLSPENTNIVGFLLFWRQDLSLQLHLCSLFFVLRSFLQESSFTDDDECKGLNGEECLIKRSLIAHTDYIYTQRNVGP